MNTFGNIKIRIIKHLSEAFLLKDKKAISDAISMIKENKDFLELYNFYEDIENKYFEDKEMAKIYVEEISKMLSDKATIIENTCKNFDKILTESVGEKNNLYDALDQLLGTNNIRNLDKKLVAKKNVVEYLTTEKTQEEKGEIKEFTVNESLLSTVLINNFNTKYKNILSEEEKNELKEIMSMTTEQIENDIKNIKENIKDKITQILSENKDVELKFKLDEVRKRIDKLDDSRLSYFKIKNLEKDL